MTPLWAVFTFLNLWCVALFAVISLGNTHRRVVGEHDYAAAPDAPNFRKKFWWATLISGALTAIIALLMEMGIIRFV